jgi:error-prone DNA polymerase
VDGWPSVEALFKEAFLAKSSQGGIFRSDLASLAAADAFHAFGMSRKDAFWMAESAPHIGFMNDIEDPYSFAAEASMERIQQDLHATGVTLGDHPAAILRDNHWCFAVPVKNLVSAKDISSLRSHSAVQVFGMVLVRQAPPSAKGMVFFTLEDENGYINLVFTPQLYERVARFVDRQAFLCVSGKLQGEKQGYSILVQHVYEPVPPRREVVSLSCAEPPQTDAPAFQKARNYM